MRGGGPPVALPMAAAISAFTRPMSARPPGVMRGRVGSRSKTWGAIVTPADPTRGRERRRWSADVDSLRTDSRAAALRESLCHLVAAGHPQVAAAGRSGDPGEDVADGGALGFDQPVVKDEAGVASMLQQPVDLSG